MFFVAAVASGVSAVALAPVTDNSGCSIAANTASGNPLCTHCNWGTKECDTGFYDGFEVGD